MTAPTTTATHVPSSPTMIDMELDHLARRIDNALDDFNGPKHDAALSLLQRMASRRADLEGMYRERSWNRFYQDSYDVVHVAADCYAAATGTMKILPEMSGSSIENVRQMYGSGRTCKKCSHGVR